MTITAPTTQASSMDYPERVRQLIEKRPHWPVEYWADTVFQMPTERLKKIVRNDLENEPIRPDEEARILSAAERDQRGHLTPPPPSVVAPPSPPAPEVIVSPVPPEPPPDQTPDELVEENSDFRSRKLADNEWPDWLRRLRNNTDWVGGDYKLTRKEMFEKGLLTIRRVRGPRAGVAYKLNTIVWWLNGGTPLPPKEEAIRCADNLLKFMRDNPLSTPSSTPPPETVAVPTLPEEAESIPRPTDTVITDEWIGAFARGFLTAHEMKEGEIQLFVVFSAAMFKEFRRRGVSMEQLEESLKSLAENGVA